MKQGHTARIVAWLAVAAIGCAGAAAVPAGAATARAASRSRSCTVKVGWYGWEGRIKEDTCANWVEVVADCAMSEANSKEERTVGALMRVPGWLQFATACENGTPNTYPFTYLIIHKYHAGWWTAATDGPFSPNYQVVTSRFKEA